MMRLCWRKLIFYVLSFFEFFSGQWFSYILRPRKSVDFGHFPDSHMGQSDARVAIVMQGPIMTKWDFTLETIKMYKMMYPDADLIVSTWIDTKKILVDQLSALDVHVVLNEYPDNPGISHINYQIVSTKEGIKKAQDMGATHCLKTRTDQRMYRHDAIHFLLAMLSTFPVGSGYSSLKGRLIGISLNTYKYRSYGISDMFMFGHMNDIVMYWDVDLDDRDMNHRKESNLLKYAQLKLCEVYFCASFLEKLNIKLEWTLTQSWQVYKDLFCIVDHGMVDLYWPKYSRFIECRRRDYLNRRCDEMFTFSDWLRIYSLASLDDQPVPEGVLRYGMDDLWLGENQK